MGSFLDSVPVSAIIKIRDLMITVKDPFRLDQGDVSFDAPDSVKKAMADAIVANHTHYLPTAGQNRGSLRPTSRRPAALTAATTSGRVPAWAASSSVSGRRSLRNSACCSRRSAFALFSCCDRLSSAMTIKPLGTCRSRTAELVLFRFCPPGPLAR